MYVCMCVKLRSIDHSSMHLNSRTEESGSFVRRVLMLAILVSFFSPFFSFLEGGSGGGRGVAVRWWCSSFVRFVVWMHGMGHSVGTDWAMGRGMRMHISWPGLAWDELDLRYLSLGRKWKMEMENGNGNQNGTKNQEPKTLLAEMGAHELRIYSSHVHVLVRTNAHTYIPYRRTSILLFPMPCLVLSASPSLPVWSRASNPT